MKIVHLPYVYLFIAVLLTSCVGPQVDYSPTAPPTSDFPEQIPDQSWQVNLIVTGGFDGIQRSMELSSNGELLVRDDRAGKQVERSLTSSELAKISSLVSGITQLKNEIVPPCADCFVYQVFIRRDNSYFSTILNDVNLEGSGVSELIDLLMGMGRDALAN